MEHFDFFFNNKDGYLTKIDLKLKLPLLVNCSQICPHIIYLLKIIIGLREMFKEALNKYQSSATA